MLNSGENSPRSPSYYAYSTGSAKRLDDRRNEMSSNESRTNIVVPSDSRASVIPVTSSTKVVRPMNHIELSRVLGIETVDMPEKRKCQPKRADELFLELYPESGSRASMMPMTNNTKVGKPMNLIEQDRELGIETDMSEKKKCQPKRAAELFLELYPESGSRASMMPMTSNTKSGKAINQIGQGRTLGTDLVDLPEEKRCQPKKAAELLLVLSALETPSQSKGHARKRLWSAKQPSFTTRRTTASFKKPSAVASRTSQLMKLGDLDKNPNKLKKLPVATVTAKPNVIAKPVIPKQNKNIETCVVNNRKTSKDLDVDLQSMYEMTKSNNAMLKIILNRLDDLENRFNLFPLKKCISHENIGIEHKTTINSDNKPIPIIQISDSQNPEINSNIKLDDHDLIRPNLENISPDLDIEKQQLDMDKSPNLNISNQELNGTVIEISQKPDVKYDLHLMTKPLKTTFEQLESRLANDSLATINFSPSSTECSPDDHSINMTWLLDNLNGSNTENKPNPTFLTKNPNSQDVYGCTINDYNEMRSNLPLLCTPKTDKTQELMTPSVKNSNKKLLSRKIQKQLFMLNHKF